MGDSPLSNGALLFRSRRPLGAVVWKRPGARFGVSIMVLLALVALSADFLASDLPILLRYQGRLYLLPNLTHPVVLQTHDLRSLSVTMEADDWLLPPLVSWGPHAQDKAETPLTSPSARHWLGTDTSRRDVLARLIHGTRVSLLVGLVSVSIYVTLGTFLGLLSGFWGGWVDSIISRLIETMLAMPVFFLILAVMGVLEHAGVGTLMVVIGLVYWTRVARLVRAETLRLCQLGFVEAAIALGFSRSRIMFRHILPNALGPILVTATFGVAAAVLVEASLSFLGFGTPDSTASWGGLLRAAMGNFHAWWLVAFPGAAIFITVMAYNLAGEALRDALDPRLVRED